MKTSPFTNNSTAVKYAAVIAVTILVVILIWLLPPGIINTTSGTIKPLEKYQSTQMTGQSIRLRNAFLKDSVALRRYLESLMVLKAFAAAVNHDLALWETDVAALSAAEQARTLKGGLTVKAKSEELGAHADFITANIGVIDRMLVTLGRIAVLDTAGRSAEIDQVFSDFENFRVRFAEKLRLAMEAAPELHNILVSNGISGICSNPRSSLGFRHGTDAAGKPVGAKEQLAADAKLGVVFTPQGLMELKSIFLTSQDALQYVVSNRTDLGGLNPLGWVDVVESIYILNGPVIGFAPNQENVVGSICNTENLLGLLSKEQLGLY